MAAPPPSDQNGAAPPDADDAAAAPPPQPPDQRDRLVLLLEQLGVVDPVCKLRKQVDASDAKPNQSRLQLTYHLARDLLESGDLTDGEKRIIHGENDVDSVNTLKLKKKNSGLKLDGYDRHGRSYEAMRFGRVGNVDGKNGNGLYRLKSFGKFVAATGLKAGHTVVAWVFRLPAPAPAQEQEQEQEQEEEEDVPARLAVVLLNYASSNPEVVEKMVEWEEKALQEVGALRGLLGLSG
uniref:Uncharacterized protein n=1 Tax=Oryza punctata TaxID=4537 RepID=A0A0E0JVY6_ORYPU